MVTKPWRKPSGLQAVEVSCDHSKDTRFELSPYSVTAAELPEHTPAISLYKSIVNMAGGIHEIQPEELSDPLERFYGRVVKAAEKPHVSTSDMNSADIYHPAQINSSLLDRASCSSHPKGNESLGQGSSPN